jgi:hypothetical protein
MIMAHHTLKSGYPQLVDLLNRFPQGAPTSEALYKILAMLFSEREAGLVALLPIKPFTAEQASRALRSCPLLESITHLAQRRRHTLPSFVSQAAPEKEDTRAISWH